jgi:hypothetical protein
MVAVSESSPQILVYERGIYLPAHISRFVQGGFIAGRLFHNIVPLALAAMVSFVTLGCGLGCFTVGLYWNRGKGQGKGI